MEYVFVLAFLFSFFLLSVSTTPNFYDPKQVVQLSWSPRAFLYKGFLSNDECDHIIDLANKRLEKSMVTGESGMGMLSEFRTSSGMFLDKHEDEVISRIERRIAEWTFLPEENGEELQVLRYEKGQKYEPHFDFFQDQVHLVRGGDRYATVLMYLSHVEMGGETIFPNAKELQEKDETWSDCARAGFAVKPKKGDALLFFSLHANGTTDMASLHGACPVIAGEKWSAAKWIRVRSVDDRLKHKSSSSECTDDNESCAYWAAHGECEKNPSYMVGASKSDGYCRKSCKVCHNSKASN